MPTPGIAYLTRTLRASAGIVISASHNPYYDNGLKFFSPQGEKLDDELEYEIEAMYESEMDIVESSTLGKARRVIDADGRYIEACKATIPMSIRFNGLKLVLDCSNGATYDIAPKVFEELGAKVIAIGDKPDGLNINFECGSTDPEHLVTRVKVEGADLGIAFDGDGDRVLMVDNKGEVVDGDELLYVIARSRLSDGEKIGGVVGTLMSNLGMEIAVKELGVGFERSKVGDRYVLETMNKNGWTIGGESSGHIICSDRTTTGDGIVSALQVLAYLVKEKMSLHEAKSGMNKFPQLMINVPLQGSANQNMADPMQSAAVQQAVARAEAKLNGRGRVLLRPSGTEPLIRVMVEGEDELLVSQLANDIAAQVTQAAKAA
jgi:phosphoglucosamine mutase